jgi:hypothetical protein
MVVLVGVGGPAAGRIETTMILGSFLCVAEDGGETSRELLEDGDAAQLVGIGYANVLDDLQWQQSVNVDVDDNQHVVAAAVGHCKCKLSGCGERLEMIGVDG